MLPADGKIVAAGSSLGESTFTSDFFVVRYNSDDTLDESFGEGGRVTRERVLRITCPTLHRCEKCGLIDKLNVESVRLADLFTSSRRVCYHGLSASRDFPNVDDPGDTKNALRRVEPAGFAPDWWTWSVGAWLRRAASDRCARGHTRRFPTVGV